MTTHPLAFRNITRYAKDVEANVPLYLALGYKPLRAMEGFAILAMDGAPNIVLHSADHVRLGEEATAIGFTIVDDDVERACKHVEDAGWTLRRAPSEEDMGFFYIYADRDGNEINLVGKMRHS